MEAHRAAEPVRARERHPRRWRYQEPGNYEVFTPEEVGLKRQIVVGKHSGSRTLDHKFREFGIELTDQDCAGCLELVRETAVQLKRALFEKELMYLYQDYLGRLGDAVPMGNGGAPAAGATEAAGAPQAAPAGRATVS